MKSYLNNILSIITLAVLFSSLGNGADSSIKLTDEERRFIENNPIITVHNEMDYPPYNFNKDDTPIGLSIDYLNLLADKLGIHVRYISGYKWSDFINMIKSGKLDVMLNIRRTSKRDEFLHFTEPYAATNKSIFTNNPHLKNLKDLKSKMVCVPKDFYIDSFLQAYYPDIILIRAPSLLDCMKSVVKGAAEATVGSHAIINYLMREYGINIDHEVIIFDKRLAVGLSIATAKDKKILRDILQKAMYAVTDEEMSVLTAVWLGEVNPHVKMTSKSVVKPYKKTRVVTMCNNPNWAPIEFVEDGKVQGIAMDTMRLIEDKLNIKFKHIPTSSWKQSQEFLKSGKCEVLPAAIETKQRREYAEFTVPYLVYKLGVITKNDKPFIDGLDDIADKSIARNRGSGLISKLKKIYPQIDIIETDDYKSSFKMVADDKAYCTIATLPVASYYINKHSLNNLYVAGYLDMRYRLSVAVNKNDSELLERLEMALSEITEYQFKEIHDRWVNRKLTEGFDYSYLWYILGFVAVVVLLLIYRQGILKEANRNLQYEIEEKVNENLVQHQFIQEQVKLAAMGEMIGVIAHQWRQPLNALGLSIQNLRFNYKDGVLDEKFVDNYIDKNLKTIKFMSQTIDDFRNFFKVDTVKENFSVKESIEATLLMQSLYLEKYDITFSIYGEDFTANGLKSEFQQVILSLINNAKDALLTCNKDIERHIEISLEKGRVTFSDNGGGFGVSDTSQIFRSRFTIKQDGLGIGLYMAKIIIENKMGGKISASTQDGKAIITIDLKCVDNG